MLTKNDLNQIKDLINPLSIDIGNVQKDLTDVKKRVRKIEGTVDVMIDHFDRVIIRTQKRVDRIGEHINL